METYRQRANAPQKDLEIPTFATGSHGQIHQNPLNLNSKKDLIHCSLFPKALDKFKDSTALIKLRVEPLVYLLFCWIYFFFYQFQSSALKLESTLNILSWLFEVNKQLMKKTISLNYKKKKCFKDVVVVLCPLVMETEHNITETFCLRTNVYQCLTSHTCTPKCLQKLVYKMLP